MDILIVGTGALATLFAARLGMAGHSVSILGTWQRGLEAFHKQGARIVDVDGREHAAPIHATDDPTQVRGAQYALVLVKAWQTERAARQLTNCLSNDGIAVTLQNGLGNREKLVLELGPARVTLGVTTAGATLLRPGLARAGGEGIISIEENPVLGPVETALQSAGFNVESIPGADALVWGKLVISAAINPLTALLRVPNGELLQRPSAHRLMAGLAREAATVAAAEGVSLPFDNPVQAVEQVAHRTAANHSSMFQDVMRGAPTEIDAICGAVTRYGEQSGVPTPINETCWRLVRALTEHENAS
jgi:2-dehydropantoate 2-reductase